jgi:muramoyltetrapeptide carboxypeptidase
MTVPPYLQPGDKIAVVAPARKVVRTELEAALQILESWQLEVVPGKNLWNEKNQFSGDDAQRRDDLQKALDAKDIKAIICARGGYGSVRIIDGIDFSGFRKNPKWIVGFSDVTVLHSHIQQNFNIETLHAPMLINFDKINSDVLSKLKDFLFGKITPVETTSHPLNKKGKAKGIICGGNLSVLYSILGSVSDIKTKGKILFLEDLDEYLYHIDRMMMAMKRAGKLNELAGVIIGGMTDMKDNTVPFGKTAEDIISEYVNDKNIPMAYHFPAGHIENNYPIIFGRQATLTVDEKVTLNYP